MTSQDKSPGIFAISTASDRASRGPAEPYSSSEAVRNFLVLKALTSASTPAPEKLEKSYEDAFALVCDDIRSGQILLDYVPEESGCVDMPPVNHPHYMQAVLYWCAELRAPMARLVEAHARVGQFASRGLLLEQLGIIEKEDLQPSTVFDSTDKWHRGPATIPLPGRPDEPESQPPRFWS